MTLTDYIMDLTERKEELIKRRERLEEIKETAHKGILETNAKLRKLETIIAHAEETLKDETPKPQTETV